MAMGTTISDLFTWGLALEQAFLSLVSIPGIHGLEFSVWSLDIIS